ncbi:single-strand binding protein [Schinkia azotoformans MEV2011]|uniref:Single-stranded DNA-binding protein n=1 Tax=Schinkia azotoformans MEV2011 TaxID=1348973 RepID=A0A072NPN2_SCHAZ|nr:single-stranded DNA-binding protein [Schinkia azotoformans]KEF38888.1 single-strand binding protein [Schinkia azotoformans MEV2011]MEC1695695.1 single-stranded DNA-binding protein [Schinkia azotoformans]MEC1727358.1 single-stranded DNA-binding protein [Schinkia azotoformans]MEC1757661.1 single-stranded DNA-binding protein [Schinkia azotoformans]MEC1770277.1 single-stranded DNA-binding protein [Schinkia azotoformans]
MINQVTLVGRITKDPELRYTGDGIAVSNFTIALNRNFKNANGQYDTDFVNCNIWRKPAETVANFCLKGSLIGITGRLQSRHYENSEGKRVYVTEVVAEDIKFISLKNNKNSSQSRSSNAVTNNNNTANHNTEAVLIREGQSEMQKEIAQSAIQ